MLPVQRDVLLWSDSDSMPASLAWAETAVRRCGHGLCSDGASGGELFPCELPTADVLDDTVVWECGAYGWGWRSNIRSCCRINCEN